MNETKILGREEISLSNKKQNLIVIKEYYDLKLKKKMSINETFKTTIDRATELIVKGFVIRK